MEAAAVPQEEQVTPEATAAESSAATPEAATPDLSEQISDLTQRISKVEGGEEPETPAPVATDLLTALMQEEESAQVESFTEVEKAQLRAAGLDPDQITPAQLDEMLAQGQQPDPRDQRLEQLAGQVEQMSQREVDRELRAIQNDYPDILEPAVFTPLQERLQGLAQRYGDGVMTDPNAVRLAYQAVKAEQADAAATSTEQVEASGASLETSAGRSKQGGDDLAEQFANKLMGAGGGSAFTQ